MQFRSSDIPPRRQCTAGDRKQPFAGELALWLRVWRTHLLTFKWPNCMLQKVSGTFSNKKSLSAAFA